MVLFWYYSGTVSVLLWYCLCTTLALLWYYSVTDFVLLWYWFGAHTTTHKGKHTRHRGWVGVGGGGVVGAKYVGCVAGHTHAHESLCLLHVPWCVLIG